MSPDLHAHRVLITGASGFMGSWLAEHLVGRGALVVNLLSRWEPWGRFVQSGLVHRVENVVGGVEDYPTLERIIAEHGVDTVFHLAAISVEGLAFQSPHLALEVNVRGTYNVLEACRKNADTVRRVIIASSDKVYGDSPVLPYTEELPLQGRHPYDVSKSCADLIAHAYAHSYGLPVAIGRFGNIYGGGDLNWSRLIPNTIRRVLAGEPPLVRVPAQGDFMRDFLYVRDAVQAYMAMFHGLDAGVARGEAFNFAMGGSWTVLEVVRTLLRLLHREELQPHITPAAHGEIFHQHVSAQKARQLLGWAPQYKLEEGLEETIAWYRQHLAGGDVSSDPVRLEHAQAIAS
ncbi:NAD(P)-dependent oxidoreductase [Vitiosangium sp. GDMCC 1.1324]|uniref:NAD-dependent epimerase/dehydratase family protein n=1 Tax=Vitiosangium sp. (strain GDMCC 1.1324) TaxID=2138576 RepID=UPI000D36134B|nr:GDP-mannose 4,6-dehydratase [Vitiosangium sp. GDMCC 1.1324]PTL76903.1 sugar dehydratase [Vitiosangium sp. GDMCC 1.1324]